MLFVALGIFEKPNVDDVVRVFGKVIFLNRIDCPFHCSRRSPFNAFGCSISDHNKRFLQDDVKAIVRQSLLEFSNVLSIIRVGELFRFLPDPQAITAEPDRDE